MIRWSVRIIYGLIIFALLLFILMTTPPALRFAFSILEKTLPGHLQAERVNGTLFGPISIYRLNYDNPTFNLKIRDLYIDWHLSSLWKRKLDIESLRANKFKITYKNKKNAVSEQKPSALEFPFSIFVKKAYIKRLTIYNPERRVVLINEAKIDDFALSSNKISGLITADMKEPYPIFSVIALSGSIEHYQITWKLTYAKDTFWVKGHGTDRSLSINLDNNNLFGGTIGGYIHVTWYPEWQWQSDIKLKNLNLHKLDAKLPIIHSANINTSGVWSQKWPTFRINAQIQAPKTQMSVNGKHDKGWDLKWSAHIQDLSYLLPNYHGALDSEGTLSGESQNPTVTARFRGRDIDIKQQRAKQIEGSLAIDFSAHDKSELYLHASDVTTPYLQADDLIVKANADSRLRHINGDIIARNADGQIIIKTALEGQLTATAWQGKLTEFSIKPYQTPEWKLQKPSPLSISEKHIALESACLNSSIGYACVDATWDAVKPWKISAKGHFPNINFLTTLLSPKFTITAPAHFTAEIRGEGTKLISINSQLTSTSGQVLFSHNDKNYNLPLQKLLIDINSKKNDLMVKAVIQLSASDYLSFEGSIPNFLSDIKKWDKDNITGNINVDVSQLGLLEQFIPYISQPSGRLRGSLKVSGHLPLPKIKGRLAVEQGRVAIPNAKIVLNNILFDIGADDNKLIYNVAATSQSRGIKISGSTSYENGQFTSEFHITGTDILVMNTPEYVVYASPNLIVKFVGKTITISGSIFIPAATIKPADLAASVSLTDDAIIIYPQRVVTNEPLALALNVDIILGDKVFIDTNGLNGQVVGKIHISKDFDQPFPTAVGQLSLNNATFTAKGKTLKIVAGSGINYLHDSLTNPHLNIRAARTVSVAPTQSSSALGPTPTEVGIDIKGTFKRPEVSLFSSPVGLSQADILSYLIFDQAASGTTSSLTNYSVLFQAFSFLKLSKKGEGSSINQIKQSLGITELGIEDQFSVDALGTPLGINQSAFVIGSYITPHIYFRYSRGLLTPINIYQIRYIINPHWSIQTEIGPSVSGVGSGVDVLYTISRKKFPY